RPRRPAPCLRILSVPVLVEHLEGGKLPKQRPSLPLEFFESSRAFAALLQVATAEALEQDLQHLVLQRTCCLVVHQFRRAQAAQCIACASHGLGGVCSEFARTKAAALPAPNPQSRNRSVNSPSPQFRCERTPYSCAVKPQGQLPPAGGAGG